jgi:hypothetical protein
LSRINNRNKSVVETDFVQGTGWYIELVRTTNFPLALVMYKIAGEKVTVGTQFRLGDRVFVPPEEDELTRHVHFAHSYGDYDSVGSLLQQIDSLISRCLDLDAGHRFLLACFVLSTWVVDRLPIAPIIAIVGLPQSGKTTVLNILHLLCRRSILTSDTSSAAFYRMCDRLIPTVLIDNTATAGLERKLFHLLRSGTTPGIVGSRWNQSYRTYGSKVVTWTELPDDDALNSRCIIIPMQETSRTDLLRPTDPEIVAEADKLQGQLTKYRFQKYSTLKLVQIPSAKHLRSRDRDLYEALALPIADDPEACARLLECMGRQHDLHNPSLPPDHAAVLETLFQLIHLQPEQGTLAFRHLADEVNLNLERTGERFRLTPKGVGGILTYFRLFPARKRVSSGCVGFLDRAARKLIHDLATRHGMGGLADSLPSEKLGDPCDFCKVRDLQSHEIPPTDGPASKLPTESADRKPFDDVQPSVQVEKDAAQPLFQPNFGDGQSFDQTEDIGSPRWIENEDDQKIVDKFKEDSEL